MSILSAPARLFAIYRDGIKHSALARRLLCIIIIKIVILFALFRLFLMPDRLDSVSDTDNEKAGAVRTSLIDRSS